MKLFKKNVRCKPLTKDIPKLELVSVIIFMAFEIAMTISLKMYKSQVYLVLKNNGLSVGFFTLLVVQMWILLRCSAGIFYLSNQEFWDEEKCLNPKGIEVFINFIKCMPMRRLSLFEGVEIKIETIRKECEI